MMLAKVLAVLSAVMLVGAVAIGTLGPPDMTLSEALVMFDHVSMTAVESYIRVHLSSWLWDYPLTALLTRPVWLLPAAAGLLLAGGALTVVQSQKAPNSRRRRS